MRRILFFFSFVLLAGLAAAASLVVGSSGADLASTSFHSGMMTLTFTEGTGTIVKRGDLPIGFLFAGKGTMKVEVTDPYARQVLGYNLQHGSHLPPHGYIIKDTFTRAMVLGTQPLALLDGRPASQADSAGKILETFDRDFLDQYLVSPPSFIMAGIRNGDTMAAAILSGGKDDLIFTHDPTWSGEENLYALETSTIRRTGKTNLRWQYRIVNQPIGHPREKPFPSPVNLKGLDYDMDWTNLSLMKAIYKVTLTVTRGGFSAIPLDLISHQLYIGTGDYGIVHDTNGWGLGGSELVSLYAKIQRVVGVVDEKGRELPFTHEGDILTIQFPEKIRTGQTLRLAIVAGGNIFEPSPNMGGYVSLSGDDWIPSPMAGYESIDALFSGKIKTKPPFRAYASFESVEAHESGGVRTLKGYSIHPESYHAIAVGKYFPKTITVKGIPVTIASAVHPNKNAYDILSRLSSAVLDLYTFFLGDYPYDHLDIIEGRGLGYGHAPAAMVFASGEIFNSLKDYETQLFSRGANERFAHELAHHYYGHLVRPSRSEDQWLSEAVAEYMAAFFMGRAKNKKEFKYIYDYWYASAKRSSPIASIYARDLLDGHDADVYRWELTYCKGPLLIHAIRKKVGEKAFWTLLRSFLRSFPHKEVTTEDFIGLLNYLTKEDWHPFFKTYLYGTAMPPKLKP